MLFFIQYPKLLINLKMIRGHKTLKQQYKIDRESIKVSKVTPSTTHFLSNLTKIYTITKNTSTQAITKIDFES